MSAPADLNAEGIRYLRVLWSDNANVIRARAVRTTQLPGTQVSISAGQLALPVMQDSVVPGAGLGPVGEAQLMPDWSTLRRLPYAPGEAQVLGDLWQDGQPWAHCPRTFLKRQIQQLGERGLSVQAAFENEFYLLRAGPDGYRPADTTVYAQTGSMNLHRAFIHALTDALEQQGLVPELYYPESGPGQQELSVRHTDALGSADQQVVFRETVRGVAQAHGYVACFLPKVFEASAGSGCHINLSLWRNGQNQTGDPGDPTGLSEEARHFIAGVLAHLPALCALTVPTPNSYRRLRPQAWAGAYRTWGYGNREAAVRVTRGRAGASRFELKTADATANPYLALGALLAAGLDGLTQQLPLPDEVTRDPGSLTPEQRLEQGIEPLPASLDAAMAALEQDGALQGALGAARAQAYLAVRRAEWTALKDLSLTDELALLAERY
ncbi:glutamine synthetase family protein [Deinococcus sonorensis]|uniref:Glutamine synthetase family protein n=2 Tax=Deinococcus sonorensis TaxID=309891 RepID=A0AAU7UGI7_9DEIO